MLQTTSSHLRLGTALGVWVSLACGAVLLGFTAAVAGWQGQIIIFGIVLPAVVLLIDYRLGLILAVLLMPYLNSKLVPSAGPLSVHNVLLLGVWASFTLRWILRRAQGRPMVLPITRELVWLYCVPLTIAMIIGSFHLGQIPNNYLFVNSLASLNLKDYWVSMYVKIFVLMLVMACVCGAAVVEEGKSLRFAVVTIISGVLFVAAIVAVVLSTGASLDQLRLTRDSLKILGRDPNEAAVMLLGALAPALFMREFVRHPMARFALLLAVLIIAAGILLTFSRGAFIGLLVVLVYYVLHFRRLGQAIVVITLVVAGLTLAPSAIRDRLTEGHGERALGEKIGSANKDEALTAGRFWIVSQLVGEIPKNPVVGSGVMSTVWSNAVKNGVYFANHPHNLYLEILMDLGLLGAICIGLFYRYVWRLFRKLTNEPCVPLAMRGYFGGAAAGMLGMLAYGVSNGHYYPAPEQLFFWVSIGLALGYHHWLAAKGSGPQMAPPNTIRGAGVKTSSEPRSGLRT